MSSNAARLSSAELIKVNELRALLHAESGDEEDEDNDATNSRRAKSRKFNDKFNKIFLEFSASSCLVDLHAIDQAQDQSAHVESHCLLFIPVLKYKLFKVSEERRKLWPYLFFLLWLACTLHLSYYLYHQYVYDYYLFRLSRVRWLNHTQPPEVLRSYRVLEREDFLLEELRRRGDQLKQIGAPNMKLSFVIQCIYLHLALTSFFLYFSPCIYFNYKSPFDFYFLRNLLNRAQERRQNNNFVQAQAHKLATSIGNWSLALRQSGVVTHDRKLLASCCSGLIDCTTAGDSLLCKQLDEMLALGLLRPLNQRARWVRSWSVHYSWIMIVCYIHAISLISAILWLQVHFLDKPLDELTANEWLIYAELLYLMITIQLAVALCGLTLVLTCWDQAVLVNKLRKLLALTIELNDLRFYGCKMFAHKHSSEATRRANQTNRDILLVLMHYRIFVSQLVRLKQPLGFIAATAVGVMFLTPILGRLHVPYFQIDSMQAGRILVVMDSILIVIPVNVYLVPVCYLNKRCIDLYRELNSLLAHVTQISHDSASYPNENLTHDRYLIISLLRKELSHHDQVIRKMAIKFLGLNFTYDTLVRLHFYVGFIVLTIMGENLAQIKEQTGSIFTDPLNLF